MSYDHVAIEKKWQRYWHEHRTFATPALTDHGFYCLGMFPYPSGAGLHIGHPKGYVATDIVSRMKRAQGFDVLQPMGWDAFGLPAENYAIKTGVHPSETTNQSIERFRSQLQQLGLGYDWEREVNTSDPRYYRWTQWLFLKLYEHGLAYKKQAAVNWCPKDQTVLANEQVVNGACERCGTQTEQRLLDQWFFKITDYADELLRDIEQLDWPEPIKAMQRNWIGKSTGASLNFTLQHVESTITVFTTRPETLYGVTYLVLAPEHPLVPTLWTPETEQAVQAYVDETRAKSELDRKRDEQRKTGVHTGSFALHPLTGELLPIWIADYVLGSYGTGAVMAVPAHDERDWAFAKAHDLAIKQVVEGGDGETAYLGHGKLVSSGEWTGIDSANTSEILASIEALGIGTATTEYRLRDWLVSRQRYWGPPIPILYCDTCGMQPVPLDQLPVMLPDDVDFRPTGESPLSRSESFHQVQCPTCNGPARRDNDTLDTFVDSSWYFLRYADPANDEIFADPKKLDSWLPVDLYVGGAEHAVLHLLYARFITKALDDTSSLGFREPFLALRNQGLIMGEDGRKMSKSLGNVVNPDEIVVDYGADTLRLYEMFMGPFEDSAPWNTGSMVGIRRWLDRLWNLASSVEDSLDEKRTNKQQQEAAALIRFTTNHIETFRFNTVVSQFMITTNSWQADGAVDRACFKILLQLVAPFAPHIAEELWQQIGELAGIATTPWPALRTQEQAQVRTIVVQVDGKVRGTLPGVDDTVSEDELIDNARAIPAVERLLGDQETRVIVVPGRLVNFVRLQP